MKKNILLIIFLFSLSTIVYGQCGVPCQLNGIGVNIWLGDADSQNIGDLNNDDEDDDDFIGFKNYSSLPVNISGWKLYTDQNGTGTPVFTFPSGTVLQPGQYTLIVADWNPGPPLPPLWFDANFESGEGMFEETSNNVAWAILQNPSTNRYITIHQQGIGSQGQSLPSGTKVCNTNVTDLIPEDFDGCEAVFFDQNTCSIKEITHCSLPLIQSPCGMVSAPSLNALTLRNTCPAMSVDLNSLYTGILPYGMTLVWFTNNTHSGSPVNNPSMALAGAYYAFYYNAASNCYSSSSNVITVSITDDCYCTKLPAAGVPDSYTIIGITSQTKQSKWPESIPNGFIALESRNKGFVITRVVNQTKITDPKEGMLIYDISASCVKIYNGSIWKCIQRQCNN